MPWIILVTSEEALGHHSGPPEYLLDKEALVKYATSLRVLCEVSPLLGLGDEGKCNLLKYSQYIIHSKNSNTYISRLSLYAELQIFHKE